MRYELNRSKFLDEDEQKKLKEILDKYSNRDTLLIKLALHTGARASELLAIKKQHLSDRNKSILIFGLKDNKNREIPLKSSLYKELKEYVLKIDTEIIFNISYQRLYQIWDFYRPVKKKFHSLRHTFAVELHKRTKDMQLIQRALGHRSISTTSIYTDYAYDIQEMRRIL